MAILPVLVGAFFVAIGWYGFSRSARDPEVGTAGWLSYPAGRRVGGMLTMIAGATLIALAALLG